MGSRVIGFARPVAVRARTHARDDVRDRLTVATRSVLEWSRYGPVDLVLRVSVAELRDARAVDDGGYASALRARRTRYRVMTRRLTGEGRQLEIPRDLYERTAVLIADRDGDAALFLDAVGRALTKAALAEELARVLDDGDEHVSLRRLFRDAVVRLRGPFRLIEEWTHHTRLRDVLSLTNADLQDAWARNAHAVRVRFTQPDWLELSPALVERTRADFCARCGDDGRPLEERDAIDACLDALTDGEPCR